MTKPKKIVALVSSAKSDLPIIQLGNISDAATKGEQVLLDAGVEIYQYAGTLVRPIVETVTAANGHKTKIARLKPVEFTYLRDLLSRQALWQAFNIREKKWVERDPPKEIAQTILARSGEWKFPVIVGVITTPTMRPDGSLLTEAGFDPATQLLLVGPPTMPQIPDEPTMEDARLALSTLEDLLREFPFADEVSKAVALSAIITPIARGAYSVAPMHVCTAPNSGSGKSYLWDVVASIAIGQPMPVMAAGRTEEETEKRLGAALMVGQPLISIDNVTGGLGGDALCIVVERSSVNMRILGLSQQARIEARGTTFYASGNNISIIGDVCRRVITVTLNPGMDRPELREFNGNPVANVMSNRGACIAAALTICRAYMAAGRPKPAKRLGSFEGWSDVVRSALIWLGAADPVASMELATAQDPERLELQAMMEGWAEAIGVGYSNRCTLADVIDKPDDCIAAAVQAVAGKKQKAEARSLGSWFRKNKDRVLGGHCFKSDPNDKGKSKWWLEPI
jgi:putative DNA primase/helicase